MPCHRRSRRRAAAVGDNRRVLVPHLTSGVRPHFPVLFSHQSSDRSLLAGRPPHEHPLRQFFDPAPHHDHVGQRRLVDAGIGSLGGETPAPRRRPLQSPPPAPPGKRPPPPPLAPPPKKR